MTAKKVGQWEKAGRVLRNLVFTVPEASLITRAASEHSAQRLRSNIERQRYRWPELAPSTKRAKAREGKDPRKLIATGEYVKSIGVISMGPRIWGVGIRSNAVNSEGVKLSKIGLWHEYGTRTIPARPHWRKEYRNLRRDLSVALIGLLGKKVRL